MRHYLKALLAVGIGSMLPSQVAMADGMSLAGSFWRCTRAADKSQFIIAFYPGGGVGGGDLQDGKVIPYIFDATNMKDDEWPGRWDAKGNTFRWSFPDQNLEINGTVRSLGLPGARLSGTLASSGPDVAVSCTGITRLPSFGDGYVIPRNSRFIDQDGEDAELKVPAGISLPEPSGRR